MLPRLPFLLVMLLSFTLSLSACSSKYTPPKENATSKQVESHFRLGLDALEKNNLPKAFDELLHAEELNPKRADVIDALAYAWRLRGDLEKSHAYYLRALAIDPAARTWNNYGTLLLTMKKPEEAEEAFRKALEDPRYNRPDFAYINLGDALLMQNRLSDAIAAYRQARLLNPSQEASRLREAAAYREHGNPGFAQAMYETILRDSPANRQALEGLLVLLRNQGDKDGAQQQLQRFIKQTPEPMDRAWAEQALRSMQR